MRLFPEADFIPLEKIVNDRVGTLVVIIGIFFPPFLEALRVTGSLTTIVAITGIATRPYA